MKRFFLVLTFLTLCLMLCASASADSAPMQLMRMNPLAFSKQPTRIESVTPTPDGSFVIIYFADSDTAGMQEMRLELFDAAGASLLSAALGDANLLEEGAPYPRGQVILEKNRFVCEYYPDITTMEVYKQRIYRYTGKQVQKPTTKKLKFGAACYAERVGDYMFRMQAHSEDESDASPYRTVKISHIASGKQKTLYLYDWSFCAFPDADGNLLFAQQNERGNLEIRQYSASMQETIVELDSGYFDDNLSYVSSAACIESTVYLLISQGFSKYTLLTYDREAQKITDSRAFSAAEDGYFIADFKTAGSSLLSVDAHWNVPLQRRELHIYLLGSDWTRTALPLQHDFCLYVYAAQESITTVEADGSTYFLCQYVLHTSGISSGEM